MKQAMAGKVLNLVQTNQPVAGCTISQQLYQEAGTAIFVFSLAAETSISAESYQNYKLLTVQSGAATITGYLQQAVKRGESIILPRDVPVGVALLQYLFF